uniref:Uncharacterized protein n=1 Tax=Arundo donax TaxID=35708 RepID=A0A0A9ABK7_ARUDO
MPSDGILLPATATTKATASTLPTNGRSGTPHALAAALQGFCSSSRTVCASLGSLLMPWIYLALICKFSRLCFSVLSNASFLRLAKKLENSAAFLSEVNNLTTYLIKI